MHKFNFSWQPILCRWCSNRNCPVTCLFPQTIICFCYFLMPLPAVVHRRHSVLGLSVCPWLYTKSLNTISYGLLAVFHQIFNFGRVGTKMNQSHFEIKGQCHSEIFWRRHTSW